MKKIAIVITMLISIFVVGCSGNKEININEYKKDVDALNRSEKGTNESLEAIKKNATNEAINTDKFEEENTEVLGSLGHGLTYQLKDDEYIEYKGEEVELEYRVEIDGITSNVGFLLFVEGKPQPYKIKNKKEEEKYLHEFDVENGKEIITFQFMPVIGKEGEVVELAIMSIYNAKFKPDLVETSSYGFYHNSLTTTIDKLKILKNVPIDKEEKEYDNKYVKNIKMYKKELTKEYLESRIIESEDLQIHVYADMLSKGKRLLANVELQEINELKLVHYLYGVTGAEYVTTFYLDHTPIYSVESTLEKGNAIAVEIELNKEEIKENKTFYAISIPKHQKKYKDKVVGPYKTASVLFVSSKEREKEEIENKDSISKINIETEFLKGNTEAIYDARDKKLLLRGEKVRLYDYDTNTVVAEGEAWEKARTEKVEVLDNGFVVTVGNKVEVGFGFKSIFLTKDLEVKKEVDITDICQEEIIADIKNIVYASDGKKILVCTESAVYLYDVEKEEKRTLFTYGEYGKQVEQENILITGASFVKKNQQIVFTASTMDIQRKAGDESYSTYGFMDLNGQILMNKKPEYGDTNSIILLAHEDFTILDEMGEMETGEVIRVDNTTFKEEKIVIEEKSVENIYVASSKTGKYFVTIQRKNDMKEMKVFETLTGKLLYQEQYKPKENASYKVIVDEEEKDVLILEERNIDNQLKVTKKVFQF